MFYHEGADTERFEQVILEAVRQVLAASGPESFFDWARTQIPHTLHLDELDLDAVEIRRLAHLLGTAVWNATPQPAQGYRVVPLPSPPRVPPAPAAPVAPMVAVAGTSRTCPSCRRI